MPLALSKYYNDMKLSENTKSETMDMIENIRNTMIDRIKKLEWLDKSTRESAIEKVLKIKYFIGYSENFMDVEKIYNLYKSSFIANNDTISFLISYMSSIKYAEYEIQYNIYFNDFSMSDVIVPSFIANAFYDTNNNSMYFPAAILQAPIFDINQPNYINYGNLGNTVGHELTHAFDNDGKMYDADGLENNWWTDNDNEEFNEFSQCFIDQYSSFSIEIEGEKYYNNGEISLAENLSDNGGLERAYEGWKLSIENNPEKAEKRNMKLPGLHDYTMDQLFYISYAHSLCSVGIDISSLEIDHSPSKFRVNGAVMNSKGFAKAFNCPAKSPMNPKHKCVLW